MILANDIVIQNQRFAEVYDARAMGIDYSIGRYDGILGLGFSSLSVDGATPVFENAVQKNAVDQPMFAIYLGDNDDDGMGEITFGGYDATKFVGDLVTVPLASATFWHVAVDAVSAGRDTRISYLLPGTIHDKESPPTYSSTTTGIVASGTGLIFGPVQDVAKVAVGLGADSTFMGFYALDCDYVDSGDMPDVVFTIHGVDFPIPGRKLVWRAMGVCLLAVLGLDLPNHKGPPQWILGELFMREYYTVFNTLDQTISFAKAAKH